MTSCTQELGASAYNAAPAASRALCLCYDGAGQYAGERWDVAEAECLSTGSSAFPSFWSAVSEDGPGWCSSKFESAAMATTAPSPLTPMTSTQGFVTSTSVPGPSSVVDETSNASAEESGAPVTFSSNPVATSSVFPESPAEGVPVPDSVSSFLQDILPES